LKYIYTGSITIKNEDHAEAISSIAYEFLLDDLMKFCRAKVYPAILEEPIPQVARSLRRMVGNSIGSDIFFVVKRKKLFAHRVILYIFSNYFKRLLDEKSSRRSVLVAFGLAKTYFYLVLFLLTLMFVGILKLKNYLLKMRVFKRLLNIAE